MRSRIYYLKFIYLTFKSYRFARLILYDCVKNLYEKRNLLKLNEEIINL